MASVRQLGALALVAAGLASGCSSGPDAARAQTARAFFSRGRVLTDPISSYNPQIPMSLPAESASIEEWSTRYPDAAWGLLGWGRRDEETATKLIAWDKTHPEHFRVLVLWALTHRYESGGAFLYERSSWDVFAAIVKDNPDAVEALLAWVRRSPAAARELATHPAALTWLTSAGRY